MNPPTLASNPLAGMTSSRSALTSVVVSASCGALSGYTSTIARSSLIGTGTAAATFSVSAIEPANASRAAGSVAASPSTVTISGPLYPGPNPSASRSYARRTVLSSG